MSAGAGSAAADSGELVPSAAAVVRALCGRVSFVTGVPDSLLADLIIELQGGGFSHAAAPNEGSAIGLAAGHHLATGGVAVVYMQNSGLGNATNPLLSLAHRDVYGIPMLLFVGWRGEPGVADEPQHRSQGKVTPGLLELAGVPYEHLPSGDAEASETIVMQLERASRERGPTAILVSAGSIKGDRPATPEVRAPGVVRADAINSVLDRMAPASVIVATTGYTARELAELRKRRSQDQGRDFLVVGSMGHASSIATGVALERPDRQVWCLDGDGALMMHLGALPLIGSQAPPNLVHVVFANGIHESVGGQPTVGASANLSAIARASGYAQTVRCTSGEELGQALTRVDTLPGPWFVEVVTSPGSIPGLGRPDGDLSRRRAVFHENFFQ